MDPNGNSNDSEPADALLNERILPVELQSPNTVHLAYHPIVTPNVANGRYTLTENNGEPKVTIIEQPQQRGFRFRYECEGPSHGGLQGMKSERGKKSYPTIKIENYSGAARVLVSLVTDEENPRCHAHKLVGTNCKNGQGSMDIPANSDPIVFPNLCILHVTRRKLVDVLTERIIDTFKLSRKLKINNMNFEPEITDEDREKAKGQAKDQSKNMQLNVVRLCFQVFLRNPDGSFGKMLTPVVSQPIFDSKSPGASALKICRMDKYGGCCSGNEEVFLLCERVQKDDIQVRFVEQGPDGNVKWESYGNFGPLDVHRQYAIVFKTPQYYNTNIEKAVNVFIMLQRKSDQEMSEPIAFTYFPQNRDKDNIASKKRKRIPLDGCDFGDGGGFGGGGFGDGGSGGGGSDMDDGSNGGGGGAGLRGGNQLNTYSLMNSSDMGQQRSLYPSPASLQNIHQLNILPVPVREALNLQSEPFVQTHQQFSRTTHTLSQDRGDLWFDNSHHRIQVDTDRDLGHSGEEDNLSVPNSPLPDGSFTKKSIPSSPSHIETDDGFVSRDSRRDKLSVLSSNEYLDSGVVDTMSKPFMSMDDRKYRKDVKIADTLSISSSVSGPNSSRTKSESSEKKTSKSSSAYDTHSESDLKGNETHIKSDEGFSESSESKLELKTPGKQPILDKNIPSPCKLSDVKPEISDTLKKVTGHITERTVMALQDYAETGDILPLLLIQRHLMTVNNNNGDLPLHLGIINSQMQAVRNLVKIMSTLPQAETFIDSYNLMRQTPLHLATILDQQSVVELLLHVGADPTLADRNGNTPAHLSVMNQTESCLQSLVKYVRPTASKSNPFPELNYLNFEGFSPVHIAAMSGNVPMLKRLVFGKADVDLPDGKSGKTPLHHAVDNNDLAVASYLLMDESCDVNARCYDGNTALHIACARQRVGMVALLMSAGADADIENEEIPDPLLMREEGPKLNRRGHTPADYADGNEKILSILYKDYDSLEASPIASCEPLPHQKTEKSTDKDLHSLGLRSRIALSHLLDPSQKDILALADKLYNTTLSSTLQQISEKGNSATTFLLEYIESQKGTLKMLEDGLVAIGREDAVALLRPHD